MTTQVPAFTPLEVSTIQAKADAPKFPSMKWWTHERPTPAPLSWLNMINPNDLISRNSTPFHDALTYAYIILCIVVLIYLSKWLFSSKSNFDNTCDIMPQSCVASGTWALPQMY
jgi:hypothetical protein